MPVYNKSEEIIGYVIGERVYCEYCWKQGKEEAPDISITKKDLKRNRYVSSE